MVVLLKILVSYAVCNMRIPALIFILDEIIVCLVLVRVSEIVACIIEDKP